MLTKLVFKNVGKSMQDFTVYFFTLVFGVSIFYMFNSIYAQQDIMVVTEILTDSMIALRKILSVISVFVAVILGFLIVYANSFFIRRRKKEMGIYMTLGMSKGKISAILVFETFLMGLLALIAGLIIGVFGSQFMSVFTAKIFEADMTAYKFIFSPDAAVKSILYFAVIFLTVIIFNTIAVSKYKLIDLIYGGRKNESLKIRSTKLSVLVFLVSIVFLGTAYALVLKNGIININRIFLWSIILGTAGSLLFFFSLSGILTKLVQSNKKLYYKNLTMFVTRQLTSKINTNFISISVVSIVLLLVIGIFSTGYSMKNILSADLKETAPYDVSFYGDGKGNYKTIYESLPLSIKGIDAISHEYSIYRGDLHYKDFPVDYSSLSFDIGKRGLDFVMFSDYQKFLEMQGMEKADLPGNGYFIIASGDVYQHIAQQFLDRNVTISLGGKTLQPKGEVQNIKLSNSDSGITFVVNDGFSETLNKSPDQVLNMICKTGEGSKELQEKLNQYSNSEEYQEKGFWYYSSREEIYASSLAMKAIISFLAIYLGIVFMVACAAILAIQQLAQASDNKERYALLRKLGAEKKMLDRALFVQILCYFLLPFILGIVHSIVGLTAVNNVMMAFERVNVMDSVFIPALFIVLIYGVYFGLTYIGCKHILRRDQY
ncbi:FtsX-like permease family protein [Lacrimispora sphenoides]|uniref:ABC transport system permease protein n=1 Tax=Lacrimispora sphenoides JCM 1415 TaxID=1297793 RepID=A0ABY1C9R1_9FIRM|nr:ABC transporter permease [Lacrimispora sphenoides]SET84106.1 putative ABC transport system permease protein [[Clostridium] sphenoides JCM 1415]SUY51679.1 ABC transporter [Lacrimispora sphenoides]